MNRTNRVLLKGNEAAVYGALLAGCECYFGYPITPASEIAHASARLFPAMGRVFIQAECEIASINMVMGASAAGKRVMTASSATWFPMPRPPLDRSNVAASFRPL